MVDLSFLGERGFPNSMFFVHFGKWLETLEMSNYKYTVMIIFLNVVHLFLFFAYFFNAVQSLPATLIPIFQLAYVIQLNFY